MGKTVKLVKGRSANRVLQTRAIGSNSWAGQHSSYLGRHGTVSWQPSDHTLTPFNSISVQNVLANPTIKHWVMRTGSRYRTVPGIRQNQSRLDACRHFIGRLCQGNPPETHFYFLWPLCLPFRWLPPEIHTWASSRFFLDLCLPFSH